MKHPSPWPGTRYTFLLLACMYFMQGLPAGLLARALPAIARDYGMAPRYIGLLSLLALPWVLKFLWAPIVDRWHNRRMGHSRAWILVMQLCALGTLLLLSWLQPERLFTGQMPLLFSLLLLLNFFVATQDIATDGLAVRLLKPSLRGPGNSIQAGGYKIGLLLGGGFFLLVVSVLGWQLSIGLMIFFLVLLLLPVWFFSEPPDPCLPEHRVPVTGYWWHSLRDFWLHRNMLLWLLLLLGYKIGDGFGTRMIKPMLIDRGWTLAEVGGLDIVSSLAGLLGVFAGGILLMRLARVPALVLFGLLQAISFFAWGQVVDKNVEDGWVWSVSLFEQVADGLSTVALFTLMMDHCRAGHEGGDYTQQSCIQLMAVGLFSIGSGFSAEWLGYENHFYLAAWLGLFAIIPALFWVPRRPGLFHSGDKQVFS